MDWDAERTWQVLRRIVALLLLLAALAERSDRLPTPLRGSVMWVLRRAEAVARAFVTGEADDGTCLDAASLARRFRVLAAMLDGLAAEARYVTCRQPAPCAGAVGPAARGLAQRVPAMDTS